MLMRVIWGSWACRDRARLTNVSHTRGGGEAQERPQQEAPEGAVQMFGVCP